MLLFALALAQAAPFDTKVSYIDHARRHCAARWTDDFEMQGHCLKQQAAGMLAFKAASDSVGKPLERALEKCVEQWTKNRTPDFEMIGYCATKQAEGYKALNASPAP